MASSDPYAAIRLAREKMEGRAGLIRSIEEILVGPGEPRIYTASCIVASVDAYLETDIEGRDVILVEDIVDSGLTLRYLRTLLSDRNPASLENRPPLGAAGRPGG